MPELPEVEAARRAVQEHCGGKRIIKAMIADDTKVIDGITPSGLEKGLIGKKIIAAHRKGKNMWLQLDSPPFPSFQFGMTGAVYIKGVSVTKYKRSAINDKDEWPSKFSKVFVELDDGTEMSFTDKRRFARVRLLENPETVPPISELGRDALLDLIPEDDFINALSKRDIAIKSLLLDQGFIAGIGNWVADEVLYQARIHPLQSSSTISRENCKSLHKCIKEVIKWAVQVDADSDRFPCDWIFHYRWAKRPGKVNGKKIEFITVGGRTSAYVPDLQNGPAPGNQPDKKGGNRSRKKSDVIESEILPSSQETSDDNEGEGKKGQGKRKGKRSKTSKAGTARLNASGMEGKSKKSPKKAKTLKEKVESKQKSEDKEVKEERQNHIMKNAGKGQESAKTWMIETASSGKNGKQKRTIAAGVEKLNNRATKNVHEFDMLDQTTNPDASAKASSENTNQAQKRKRGPKLK